MTAFRTAISQGRCGLLAVAAVRRAAVPVRRVNSIWPNALSPVTARGSVSLCVLAVLCSACAEPADGLDSHSVFAMAIDPDTVAVSRALAPQLNVPGEGRFLADGAAFIVLDRNAPYVHLFRRTGELMWTGAASADEGAVFVEAVGAEGLDVLLLSRGTISSWIVEGDSLRRTAETDLPAQYLPLGAARACNKGWRIYLLDEAATATTTSPEPIAAPQDLLETLARVGVGDILIYPAALGAIRGGRGHAGTTISQHSESTVLLHRPSQTQAGFVLELTCAGEVVRQHSEHAMATGDGIPVLVPRTRALEWMGGVVAVPSGFLIAMQRWFTPGFHDVEVSQYLTEMLHFDHGEYAGSTILRGQWMLLDRDSNGFLLAASQPQPMVIVLPESTFARQGT
jgi:hypothetical protein